MSRQSEIELAPFLMNLLLPEVVSFSLYSMLHILYSSSILNKELYSGKEIVSRKELFSRQVHFSWKELFYVGTCSLKTNTSQGRFFSWQDLFCRRTCGQLIFYWKELFSRSYVFSENETLSGKDIFSRQGKENILLVTTRKYLHREVPLLQ